MVCSSRAATGQPDVKAERLLASLYATSGYVLIARVTTRVVGLGVFLLATWVDTWLPSVVRGTALIASLTARSPFVMLLLSSADAGFWRSLARKRRRPQRWNDWRCSKSWPRATAHW